MIQIICPVCGKQFSVKESRLNRTKHDICCSKKCSNVLRSRYYLGMCNPNCKSNYDREYFKEIDTELKAYILGWVASDGSIKEDTICIKVHQRDQDILKNISIKTNGLFKFRPGLIFVKAILFSKEIVIDICKHLKVQPGKKDAVVTFPELSSKELSWAFLRGFFDGDGSIRHPGGNSSYPQCNIATTSKSMRDSIETFCQIPCNNRDGKIEWYGNNALDFLGNLYETSNIFLNRKRDAYIQIAMWVPSLHSGKGIRGREAIFYWSKTNNNAIPPFKVRASDSGFDLTLVELVKKVGKLEYYSTNIKVRPAYGWYFDMVPRSSMPKTGYCIANDIGIIDRTYTGPIIAVLRKFDENAEDLKLPARIIQIIPRQIIHPIIEIVDDLDKTDRGAGGFGSTGV